MDRVFAQRVPCRTRRPTLVPTRNRDGDTSPGTNPGASLDHDDRVVALRGPIGSVMDWMRLVASSITTRAAGDRIASARCTIARVSYSRGRSDTDPTPGQPRDELVDHPPGKHGVGQTPTDELDRGLHVLDLDPAPPQILQHVGRVLADHLHPDPGVAFEQVGCAEHAEADRAGFECGDRGDRAPCVFGGSDGAFSVGPGRAPGLETQASWREVSENSQVGFLRSAYRADRNRPVEGNKSAIIGGRQREQVRIGYLPVAVQS